MRPGVGETRVSSNRGPLGAEKGEHLQGKRRILTGGNSVLRTPRSLTWPSKAPRRSTAFRFFTFQFGAFRTGLCLSKVHSDQIFGSHPEPLQWIY